MVVALIWLAVRFGYQAALNIVAVRKLTTTYVGRVKLPAQLAIRRVDFGLRDGIESQLKAIAIISASINYSILLARVDTTPSSHCSPALR